MLKVILEFDDLSEMLPYLEVLYNQAKQSKPESQYPTETYEEIEEKQRKALMSVLPRMKLCNSESLCNNCLRILDDIIKAVENPEAIIGDT